MHFDRRFFRLFKFLELPQVQGDLTAVGTRAVAELNLRGRVRNSAAPGWVHGEITRNASLHGWLRGLRREMEYAKVGGKGSGSGGGGGGGSGGGGLGAGAGEAPAVGVATAVAAGRQLDGP